MMSTGLPRLQVAGSTRPRRSIVSGANVGQPPACRLERIDGQHAGAAAIGHDGEPVADLLARQRQRLDRIEQLGHCADPQHAGAAERGVVHRVAAGQHAGMRGRRPRTRRGTPGLQHQHRLGRARRRAPPT